MDQLKPCPFCGGRAEIQWGITPKPIDWVECIECGARVETYFTAEEAIAAWNRREEINNILQRLETDWDIAKKNYKETYDPYFAGKMDGIDIAVNRIMTGGKE